MKNTFRQSLYHDNQRVISVDIMKDGGRRYYKTIKYRFTPPIDLEAFYAYLVTTLPSLAGKSFVFAFNDGNNEQVWGEFSKK